MAARHPEPNQIPVAGNARHLIGRQLRRAPREFTLGGVGTTIYAAMTVLSSFVIGWITDDILLPAADRGDVTTASLAAAAGAVIGVGLLRGFGIAMRRTGAYYSQYRLQYRDRIEVTSKYLDLPTEWHRRHPTGQLLANANEDVEAASFIASPLPMAFGVILMLIATAVILIVTDPFLALIGFMVGPAILVVNYTYQRRMRAVAAKAQSLRAEVADIAHESFDAALVVKTLGREDDEVGRFGSRSDELRDRMVEVGGLRAVFDPVMDSLPNLGILAVLVVGAWRVDQGIITAGTLVSFAYLFRLVALPMRVFGWLLGELPRSIVGLSRVESVLDADESFAYGQSTPDQAGGAGARVSDIAYRYEDSDVEDLLPPSDQRASNGTGELGRGVESVTLEVPPGKTVAIVGPTGAGKSTIAHLLVRLFDPDTGRISFDGHMLLDIDRESLADSVSIVFQETFLFNDTIYNNITLDQEFPEDQVYSAARLAMADGFIQGLENSYSTLVGERGASLSGGQRQRIAIARALVRHPRLLVLDDATSAVDPAVEGQILEGLRGLDTTVVIVAYRRSSIVLADEVIFVDDGRVIDRGQHEDLYRTLPEYRNLIDAYEKESA